jgi:16S rRNA (guanine527-N7)-methyltransferase
MDELVRNETFTTLLRELKTWNEHTNLTAIRTDEEIILKHFKDSLTLLDVIPDSATTLLDVGTGAGFPGVPLAITRPNLKVTLLDSTQKKIAFHEHVIKVLRLKNLKTKLGRAEEVAHDHLFREHFDVVVARALAELRILVEYTLPFVKVGGICIAQKNSGSTEIDAATHAIKELGGELLNVVPVQEPGLENRELIIIKKIHSTSKDYPRKAGVPAKKPL